MFQFSIIEFDPETFRILLDYLHTGSCPLTCASIPGLICAAEHYDLPELLQACFHHAKQFLRIEVVNNNIFIQTINYACVVTIINDFFIFSGMYNANIIRKLLLAVHVSFRTS